MNILNWTKKQFLMLSLAMARVEKNALSQSGESLSDGHQIVQSNKAGMLSQALKNGEVTEEVKLLRHRLYKILDESSKLTIKWGRDANGKVNYELIDRSSAMKRIKADPFDSYKVELVIDNTSISGSIGDSSLENPDDTNVEKNIICGRNGITPKFELEKYTSKLFVRYIADNERLLELYIPKYVDSYNRKSIFLVSELKKLITNPKYSDILDITTLGFITFNAIGAQDFREFVYNIIKLDKIVEHNGDYIVKFKAEVVVNGDNVISKYTHDEQEERYNNKERRK